MDKLITYLQFPPVRRALVVGVLIALCSSMLGVTLVLKRFSFIGDGLSHVAFGAMSVAAVLQLTDKMVVVLPATILCAVLLLRGGKNAKVKGDAAIAMISVGALAFGYLLMNIFSTSSNLTGDVCSTLFGSTSILTLTVSEVWICAVLSALVVLIFVLFYNKIFAVTFDEDFSRATGLAADRYNLLIAVVIAVIIVLAMNLVGSLLISALVIFPALSAMRLFSNFKAVTVCSAILSVVCAFSGMIISILWGTPVGSTIVAVDVAAFAICCAAGSMKQKKMLPASLALMVVFLMTGCGGADQAGSRAASGQSSVETVLAQEMEKNGETSASDAGTETGENMNPGTETDMNTGGGAVEEAAPDVGAQSPETEADMNTGGGAVEETAPDAGAASTDASTDLNRVVGSAEGNVAEIGSGDFVDLTGLSPTMVYSTVFDMMNCPENYMGKTVKMKGMYAVYNDEELGKTYHACIIADATACCTQGIEFELTSDYKYPDDYPQVAEEICVTGTFDTYQEELYTYCVLRDAVIEK